MRNVLSRLSRKTLLILSIVVGVVLLTGVGLAAAAALHGSHPGTTAQGVTSQTTDIQNGKNFGKNGHVVIVKAITGNSLTVAASADKKAQEMTITITNQTKITKYGQPATLSDIQVGEFVAVQGKSQQEITHIAILGFGAEGVIDSLHDGGFTLQTKKAGMVNVSVSSTTQILEAHGMKLSLTDLQPGEKVQVFGDKASDGTLNAALIHVGLYTGQVTAINGKTISVTTNSKKQQTGTVLTNDGTTYYVAGHEVPASTLQVGDTIGVAGPLAADKSSITAVSIFIHKDEIGGKVTAVNGHTITIQAKDGSSWAITVDSTTKFFTKNHQPAALADVQVGSAIRAIGTKNGDHALAALFVGIAASK